MAKQIAAISHNRRSLVIYWFYPLWQDNIIDKHPHTYGISLGLMPVAHVCINRVTSPLLIPQAILNRQLDVTLLILSDISV